MAATLTDRVVIQRRASVPRDLAPRIASAVVLAIVALGLNEVGGIAFEILVIGIGLAMSWEWGRMVRHGTTDWPLWLCLATVTAAGFCAAAGQPGIALGVIGAGFLLLLGAMRATGRAQAQMSAIGIVYVGVPTVAMIWMRNTGTDGALAILFIFLVVWTTDTFSYVCGKLIGGPKLAETLSPNKTWAGTVGGVAFAALGSCIFGLAIGHPALLSLACVGLAIATAAQCGDLTESALKRAYDVRHASNLIPGHGGFLDRMDGTVAAVTLAAGIAALIDPTAPGKALLQVLL